MSRQKPSDSSFDMPSFRLDGQVAIVTGGSRGLGNPRDGEGDYRFLSSGDPEALRASGTRFLQLPIGSVEHVPLLAEVTP